MTLISSGLSICGTEVPSILWVFDLGTAPALLYYSYIPIVISSLLIGIYVLWNDSKSLQAKLLFLVTTFFSLWIANILVQWVASYHVLLMFAWQLTAIFEIGIFLGTLHFAYVFLHKKDVPVSWKFVMTFIALVVIALTPTSLNIASYDIQNCEGVSGPLWTVIYSFEPILIVFMVWMGIRAYRQEKDAALKKQIALFTTGIALFLGTFFLSNYYGELTRVYEFNLWGPIGMVCFLVLLGYMMVRFKAFNAKLFSTQVLVVGIALLIGAQFFSPSSFFDTVITAVTFIAFLVSGLFLVRSVRREISQREEIEKLSAEKSEFMTFASHEIRNPITAMRGYASLIEDGTVGEVSKPVKDTAQKILILGNEVLLLISEYLNKSKLELGMMSYSISKFDLGEAVASVVEGYRPHTSQKGLALMSDIDTKEHLMINADAARVKEIVGNIVDNSLKYTPKGSITVSVHRHGVHARVTVSDTGVGIPADTLKHLFKKFSRADAQKVNILGSGIGLYLAKTIAEAIGGRIWAESDGKDKGSRFILEFPLA